MLNRQQRDHTHERGAQRTPSPRTVLARLGLCAVVALAPLPFGSVQIGPIALWTGLLGLVAIASIPEAPNAKDCIFAGLFAIVGLCWLVIVLAQSFPVSPWTSEFGHPVWAETRKITGIEVPSYVSATRNQPLFAAGAEIACGLALLCGYFVGRESAAARLLIKTFAVSGLVYACYGILSLLIAPDYVLWLPKVAYDNLLTSTFINANTAAVFFGSCSVVWLMILLEGLPRASSPRGPRRNLSSRLLSRKSSLRALAFAVVLTATFLTGSRLGATASILALGGASVTFYRRSLRTWRAAFAALVILAVSAVVILQLLGGRVNQRVDATGLTDENRLQTYLGTWRMISEHPWLGTGSGTFRWTFPEYRSHAVSVAGIWDRAHSTPLELAAEMGVPFACLIGMAWLLIFVFLAIGMFGRRRDRILTIVPFWCSLIAFLHSLADFSLQIPGFAVVILALAGMGLNQSSTRHHDAVDERKKRA